MRRPPPSNYKPPPASNYKPPPSSNYQPSVAGSSQPPGDSSFQQQQQQQRPPTASSIAGSSYLDTSLQSQRPPPQSNYRAATPASAVNSSYQTPGDVSYTDPPATAFQPSQPASHGDQMAASTSGYYPGSTARGAVGGGGGDIVPQAVNQSYQPVKSIAYAPDTKRSREEINLMPRRPSYMAENEDEWRLEMFKYGMFAYNIIVFFFSGILLGICIWMAVERSFMTHIIGNDWYAASIYLALCSGAIIFFVTSFGFYGAFRENRKVLKIYLGVMLFIVVVLIFTSLVAIVFRAKIGASVKNSMSTTIKKYYDVDLDKFFNRAVTKAWNKAQKKLHCCAVEDRGWALYRESSWFKKYGAYSDVMGLRYGHDMQNPYVPLSCCATDTYYTILNAEICQTWKLGAPGTLAPGAYNHALNYKGCFNMGKKYLKENMDIILGFGLTLMITLVLGIVLTYGMVQQIKVKKMAK